MRPRPCLLLLWLLLVSTTAARAQSSERVSRRGTLLVAGQPEAPPVLYVAAGTVTRVRFADLLEPRARPGPELQGRVEVAPLGEGSLVVSPLRDLAPGERLLLPVTGRTKAGESLTLTLALVTREDAVDAEAWVSRVLLQQVDAADANELGAVASRLLASHGPGAPPPRLALDIPDREQVTTYVGGIRASAVSVLQMDGLLFVTVLIQANWFHSTPWRLIRARLEAGCRQESREKARDKSLPPRIASGASGQYQLHAFIAPLPEGAHCFSLTLEEDGPRTLRLEGLKVSP
ncbi:DUF2381 family protein [Archangium sp.]|uniref:DUF2381 family protein n=1 Tax=Archangium sp. TaxID=1872627 RepID=UPI002D5D5422|nr:DUF2381 family protein [Archangium sp.]HYO57460.1 DUF2381 family protein [Archangium sp.]